MSNMDPSTQVVYAADVAVKFWPDRTTTAEVLFREEEPTVIDTDGTYITEPHDPGNSAHAAAIDAIAAADSLLRCDMPLPLDGEHDTTQQMSPATHRDALRGIDIALELLENWYEANEADYEDDEQTPMGPTLAEVRDIKDAASDLFVLLQAAAR